MGGVSQGSQAQGASGCGTQAPAMETGTGDCSAACKDLPGSGIKSCLLAGRQFFLTEPPGKLPSLKLTQP